MQKKLDIKSIYLMLFKNKPFFINENSLSAVQNSYNFLDNFSKDKIIYGINTGFGPMAQYRVDDNSLTKLQYNIIRSHSAGAGKPLEPLFVKSAMIARLNNFLRGKSGIHLDLIKLLSEFINRDICPFVPEHGSVGASGDLVQLAHIALALIGEGKVFYEGEFRKTADVLQINGLQPLKMYIREGLAVTNGTSVMTGIGILNLIYAKRALQWSIVASVMINEIASSYDDHMSIELNAVKHHIGQKQVAELMRKWSKKSKCLRKRENYLYDSENKETIFKHKLQPYYSLRCVPQILGPVYDTLENTQVVLENELNSACDNPIIDMDSQNVYHGGNFHGDYVSFEMDKLKIAITKLTMLSERQLNYLFHDRINGILPPFVNTGVLGLNYGLQAAQFTATSTTAECQTLSNPMYIHSIPNNNDNQDIVSMGTNSALLAKTVIDNSYQVLSILFMAIVQAVDCLKIESELSPHTSNIYKELIDIFPPFVEDTPKYEEINNLTNYLRTKEIELVDID